MQKNREEKSIKHVVNQDRRKALKKIAAGGAVAGVLALSGKWSKPVVDSIILPAHAQVTNADAPPQPTTTSEAGQAYSTSGSGSFTSYVVVHPGPIPATTATSATGQ